MSAIEAMLTGPLVQAIGWALLHLLWQGILVAAILAATLALLQRQSSNARYLASCGALLLLVALGVATAYRAYDPIRTSEGPPSSRIVVAAEEGSAPLSASMVVSDIATADTFASTISFANAHLAQIVAIWLAGVLILSVRLVVGWIGAHRLTTRRSQPAETRWQRSLARIASTLQLSRSITLLESAAVQVPTVIGWLRPVVLLPVASLSGLSIQQIEMVLAHELAHIRRHDFFVNLMQSVVETLLFYHPAVWWISRRIRVEREHCCDDLAVVVFGDPVQYARALTRFEELRLDAVQSVLAANGGSLIDRIRRLVAARGESANWSSRWAAGAALLTVVGALLLTPAIPLFAQHDDPPPPLSTSASPQPEQRKDDECDKSSIAPHASVDVEGAQPMAAPRVRVRAVVAPRIAIAPMIDLLDQEEQPRATTRVRRRTRIGEGGKLSVDDLIALRNAGVDPKYIEEMRSAAGLGQLSLDDLVALRLQGVTAEYVKAMAATGYKNLSTNELISMAAQGVNAAYVKSLAEAGYTNLSAKELIRLKVSGVDADFIRDLAKYRTK